MDGTDVLRHVFASLAIAARSSLDERAMLIAQVDGQSVELEFRLVSHRRRIIRKLQQLAHTAIKSAGARWSGIGFGTNRQHRHRMAHGDEARQRLAADPLRRRVRRQQLRLLGFDCLQFAKELVVLGVRYRRRVEHIVGVIVALDLATQILCALASVQLNRRRARTLPGAIRRCPIWPCKSAILARMAEIASAASALR